MTKKELEKLILEYKPKYLYQRYNGEIRKHEIIDDRFLVDVKTGMSIDFKAHLILGKISNNIIDLIEEGDYVNGSEAVSEKYINFDMNFINVDSEISFGWGNGAIPENEIKSIVTKEQFEERKFYV